MRALKYFLAQTNRAWNAFWFRLIPRRPYSHFQIVHGLSLGAYLAAWWWHATEWITTAGFHFPDEILPPLSPGMLPFFGMLQFGALALFVIGCAPRTTAAVSWLCLLYVTLVNRPAAYSLNSIYLFTFAIIASFHYAKSSRLIQAAPIRLLQLAMVTIYFSAGWHKIVYGDWLSHSDVLALSLNGISRTPFASWALGNLPGSLWSAAQIMVLVFELCSPILFSSRKLRPFAIAFGCVFHLGIALFMRQFIFFSLQMMSFYILFLPEYLGAGKQRPKASTSEVRMGRSVVSRDFRICLPLCLSRE